jgi:hypothetical protein
MFYTISFWSREKFKSFIDTLKTNLIDREKFQAFDIKIGTNFRPALKVTKIVLIANYRVSFPQSNFKTCTRKFSSIDNLSASVLSRIIAFLKFLYRRKILLWLLVLLLLLLFLLSTTKPLIKN